MNLQIFYPSIRRYQFQIKNVQEDSEAFTSLQLKDLPFKDKTTIDNLISRQKIHCIGQEPNSEALGIKPNCNWLLHHFLTLAILFPFIYL